MQHDACKYQCKVQHLSNRGKGSVHPARRMKRMASEVPEAQSMSTSSSDQETDGIVPIKVQGQKQKENENKTIINLMVEEASTLMLLAPGMTATLFHAWRLLAAWLQPVY